MSELPRITKVEALADKRLRLHWQDGRTAVVEMAGVIADFPPFAPLADPTVFAAVTVAGYGSGIAWACGLDFSADSLERLAEDQRDWSGDDIARWQDRLRISNQEAADLLGVGLTTFKNYRIQPRVPPHVMISCRAVELDRALFQARFRPRQAGRPRKQGAA